MKPQPYISQQLAILRNAGVIVDEREGINVFYRLAGADVTRQVAAACGPLADGAAGHRSVAGCVCPKCATKPAVSQVVTLLTNVLAEEE
jgi:ArsR family transcriptional regulator